MRRKNIGRFALWFALLGFSGHAIYNHYKNRQSIQEQITIQKDLEYCQKSLNQEENAAWEFITTHTGITKKQCLNDQQAHFQQENECYKVFNQKELHSCKKLSSQTQDLVDTVLKDFDIDPQSIDIISYIGNGSPAAADDWTLFVDEQDLLSYPLEAQYFVLGHEMAHVKYKDHSMYCALKRLLSQKDEAVQAALQALSRFQEMRADTFAMLKDNTYAQGGLSFFKLLQIREGKNFESPGHPKTSERILLAKNVCLMKSASKQL